MGDVCGNVPVCSICILGIFNNSEEEKLSCSHCFHTFCLKEWMKQQPTCPTCRKVITSTSFIKHEKMSEEICSHINHALQCLARYICADTKMKITGWIHNVAESVKQEEWLRKKFPPSSNYALADRYLRLSNHSIGPPYSFDELKLGFEHLKLKWDPEIDLPKYFHKSIISGPSKEDEKTPNIKLIHPPDFEESNYYKRYDHRLSSFKNFPCNYINVNSLAAIGFYYVPHLGEDNCKCAFCGLVIGNFFGPVVARNIHSLFSPLCPAVELLDAFFEHY